jgi:hypothetical protein
VKVMVVVDQAGTVVAAHVPTAPSEPYEGMEAPIAEFVPSEGEEVIELELPDDALAGEPGPEILEVLQQQKDRT